MHDERPCRAWRVLALAALVAALPACAHAAAADARISAEPVNAFDLITGAYELPDTAYVAPTALPTATPTAIPTAAPTATPTAAPTAAPTGMPEGTYTGAHPVAPTLPSGLIASAATANATPTPTVTPLGDVSAGEFSLMILVNRDNPMPEGLKPTLVDIGGGDSVDARCYDDLMLMLDDCRAAGLEPVICSAYRTQEYQTMLYENKIDRLIAQGFSAELAPALAMTVVALPGTSEHQLGLALDIVDASYQQLDEAQEHTPVQRWLMDNSYRYGFILRYPNDKSAVTGIIYEPWHYRYVGRDAAQQIYDSGLCLEEFLAAHPRAVG
ncbi:MAG TPA: M15 family metallopeptidase [Candidatus Fimadaptatus faecigallinarum]|uniref:M15 family metallopeptidase n=1 Tax=Candidatus Fimadaptatus faecigallinarum TaxID=2840814 RepID=A0A9D1LR29_9FIRM|nr:M15 family metallopeptidase [Candidatus Fimadaptatus faecigallinarum]